jgi:hypothetical protein
MTTEAIRTLLIAGLHDWVMLDEVTWEVMGGDLSAENQARTITVLDRLYGEGMMVPGDLTPGGFEDWPGTSVDWLLRSRQELERFDWKPMGAGFYLRLTDRGRVEANS